MKIGPVLSELSLRLPHVDHMVIDTGQHYDRRLAAVFVEELGLPPPRHVLGIGSGTHGLQTGRALIALERVLLDARPELMIVPGDVNSTLAGALAAAKVCVPVAHIEAGLRSFDRTMPEEINRILVDQIATWCFTHSPEANKNLRREGIGSDRVHYVGNTMIDTLLQLLPRVETSTALERFGLCEGSYVLVTLHRPALVDGPGLVPILAALARLARHVPVIFPVHPRTRNEITRRSLRCERVQFIEPLGYLDFLALMRCAFAVLTDSGGVQEETTFLRVPCFTLRSTTERPITISHGTNRLIDLSSREIERIPSLAADVTPPATPPPLWDGKAATRIADTLSAALTSMEKLECAGSAAP